MNEYLAIYVYTYRFCLHSSVALFIINENMVRRYLERAKPHHESSKYTSAVQHQGYERCALDPRTKARGVAHKYEMMFIYDLETFK